MDDLIDSFDSITPILSTLEIRNEPTTTVTDELEGIPPEFKPAPTHQLVRYVRKLR